MTDVAVTHEPDVYDRRRQQADGVSYFRDLIFREQDAAAADRLERHASQIQQERRTNPNRVQGQGGYFAPPLWLIDQFATAPRPDRVLAKAIDQAGNAFPLAAGMQSVNLPRLTTGNAGAGTGDLQAVPETDVVDAAASSPVVTITGEADVPLQLLEQSPAGAHLDAMFFQDLTEAYDAALETMLINGSGPNVQSTEQFTGLINLSGTNTVTYTDSSPKATAMFPFLGQAIAQIGNKRKRKPTLWLMTTSRAGWLGSQEDSSNRPLMISDNSNDNGSFNLLAIEVAMNDAVPVNLSGNPGSFTAGGTQDCILTCRPKDMMLWESAPRMAVMQEVLSGTLSARLQYRAYAAFICRYPTGVTVMGGTGFAVQSGF